MKVGDLVRWIGFPGASPKGVEITGPVDHVGIVIRVYRIQGTTRVNVAWGDNTIGTMIYPATVEIVNENR